MSTQLKRLFLVGKKWEESESYGTFAALPDSQYFVQSAVVKELEIEFDQIKAENARLLATIETQKEMLRTADNRFAIATRSRDFWVQESESAHKKLEAIRHTLDAQFDRKGKGYNANDNVVGSAGGSNGGTAGSALSTMPGATFVGGGGAASQQAQPQDPNVGTWRAKTTSCCGKC